MKHILKFTAKLTLLFSLWAFAQAANAQEFRELGLLFRFGIFTPSSSEASAVSDNWVVAGAEFRVMNLPGPSNPRKPYLGVSVDVYNKESFGSVPILANYTAFSGDFHLTAGAGISFVRRPGFESAARAAYQVGAGYTFPGGTPVLFEIRWFGVEGVSSDLDGFAFTLGVRI
ncbi:MAG TPA: hypothetical protein VNK96_00650 [Fimbriimonadales bacterium]|nr:hypothetical protein [Fimbriimonadales bacterium]